MKRLLYALADAQFKFMYSAFLTQKGAIQQNLESGQLLASICDFFPFLYCGLFLSDSSTICCGNTRTQWDRDR